MIPGPLPLYIVLSYIAGLSLSLIFEAPDVARVITLVFAAMLVIAISAGKPVLRLIVLMAVAACLGMVTGSLRLQSLEDSVLKDLAGKWISAEVTLLKRPKASGGKISFSGQVDSITAAGVALKADEKALIEVRCREDCRDNAISNLEEGSRVRVEGMVRELPASPGSDFDYGLYLRRHGINTMISTSPERLAYMPAGRGGIEGFVDRLRHHARESLQAGSWGSASGLFQGIVLGDTTQVPHEVIEDFRDSGLLHLLAVSGQNVVLLGFIIMLICQGLRLPRLVAAVIALMVIAVYVPLTGSDPSIVRAGIVGILGLAAMLLSRPVDRYHLLALSAAAILTLNPNSLYDPGFQLSYAAVLAIFFVAPLFSTPLAFLPAMLREPIAISAAAGLVTAPILLYHFHQVPLVTVPANVAAAPVAGPVMLLGVLTVMVAPVSSTLNWILNIAAAACTGYLVSVARFFASFPDAVYRSEKPGMLAMSAFYAIIILMAVLKGKTGLSTSIAWFSKRRPYVLITLMLLVLLAGFACLDSDGGRAPAQYTVSFLDVGQGDATLLQVPGGATILVDGGPGSDIPGVLEEAGVARLDAVVLTHPHADHLAGLESVIHKFEVDRFYDAGQPSSSPMYRDLLKAVERKAIPYTALRRGQALEFGELRLNVLHPGELFREDDANANSVVLIASYRGLDILLPGDAEGEILLPLDLRPVDVYKLGHHGSRDEYLKQVLERLTPQAAVISVGGDNSYGHPAEDTLSRLSDEGIAIYRTDRSGTVSITLAGESMEVRTER